MCIAVESVSGRLENFTSTKGTPFSKSNHASMPDSDGLVSRLDLLVFYNKAGKEMESLTQTMI